MESVAFTAQVACLGWAGRPCWQSSGRVPQLGRPLSSGSAGGQRAVLADRGRPSAQRRQGWKQKKRCDFSSNGPRHHREIVQPMVLFTLVCEAKQTYSWWLSGLRGFFHASGLILNPLYSSSHCSCPAFILQLSYMNTAD